MTAHARELLSLERVMDDEPDVADLVWRLQNGERSALGEVYDRHHDSLRRFARRLLADEHAAEDLVHDTFLALPKAIKRFEGRSSLRTFLKSVAVNVCRRHVRSAARYRRAKERYASQPPPPNHSTCTHDQAQMAALLARALDRLPVEQRVAFVLCAIEEHTSAEAATIVGTTENTIRTRLHRAKQKLKTYFDAEGLR